MKIEILSQEKQIFFSELFYLNNYSKTKTQGFQTFL